MNREFKFLIVVIILLELGIFACGLRIVYNRHNYRTLFIELERQQRTYQDYSDELNRVRLELATLEQPSNVVNSAKNSGLVPVDNTAVVILSADGTIQKTSPQKPLDNENDKKVRGKQ